MIINTRIDGDFNGTEDEVLYKLMNGQIWQQIGYRYRYTYRYGPRVHIVRNGSHHLMTVEGFPEPIKVRRIQ
ncbi:hypothetical protein PH547_11105 [Rhizobium sp. CNPSo 3464]|uniref:hypothetical protein n=1 Tax=Rhizobium sp. CNPSo 3464 TaxID=3021406 RepID=UPI00255161C9|nr:hypothetical protein [Rhizobium sp. CNPSo 3464]MDK4739421.1 hypothetical protein [Rhizobium sp. CNPSo 3464]